MEDGRQSMGIADITKHLRQVGPGGCWLKMRRVENVLELSYNTIEAFVESIKPEECGSTRRQTKLSKKQLELEADGIFFRPGHVAVCQKGDTMPSWEGGERLADIREPVRQDAPTETPPGRQPCSPSCSESSGGASSIGPTPTCDEGPTDRQPLRNGEEGGSPELLRAVRRVNVLQTR